MQYVISISSIIIFSISIHAQQPDTGSPAAIATPNAAANVVNFRLEQRIPASFREVPGGLEVATAHEDLIKMEMLRPGFAGTLEVGDILTHANQKPLKSISDLFGQLNKSQVPLSIGVVDIQTGKTVDWAAQPFAVHVPVGPPPARADGSGRVIVIHAVATSDPTLGTNIAQNIEPMKGLFESHIAAERRSAYIVVQGRQCTAIRIINALAEVNVAPQDTLLVYYQGHGAYDPNVRGEDFAAGHFFDFAREDLRRSELLRAMQAKGARLTILMSDACNTRAESEITPRHFLESRIVEVTGWTGLEEMLFCYRGTLDLTASSRGQYSWCTKDIGSWFTSCVISELSNSSVDSERSWDKTWSNIKRETESLYADRRNKFMDREPALREQTSMVPQEFIWEIERDDPPAAPTGKRLIALVIGRTVD